MKEHPNFQTRCTRATPFGFHLKLEIWRLWSREDEEEVWVRRHEEK